MSFMHVWQVLDRIASKREKQDATKLNPSKASAASMRAVADEMRAVIHELKTEFLLKSAMRNGETADC